MQLNKREVLRYLGYRRKQPLTEEVSLMVDELMDEVQAVANPRYSYLIFDCRPTEDQAIEVVGTDLVLTGNSIYQHLHKAQKVALLAATLGIEVERQIRQYEITDLTKALILDACCTEYIETICDLAECDLEAHVREQGLTLNRRFSPGYGDLPLTLQPDFLRVMEADRKLGINLSASLLMIPRKSVTAIIGLFADEKAARPRRKRNSCLDCELEECNYRIGG